MSVYSKVGKCIKIEDTDSPDAFIPIQAISKIEGGILSNALRTNAVGGSDFNGAFIVLKLNNGSEHQIRLKEVSNPAAWTPGDAAALSTALSTIAGWT